MDKNEKELEADLTKRLFQLEDEWENIKCTIKCRMDDEEEEEIVLLNTSSVLEHMWYDCPPEDFEMRQLIEEKQEIIGGIKNRKLDFWEACQEEMNKERHRMDMEAEDIQRQIWELQKEEYDKLKNREEML